MISEWAGAAIEYAFSRERPVIFIDTQPKINNLHWKKIGAANSPLAMIHNVNFKIIPSE